MNIKELSKKYEQLFKSEIRTNKIKADGLLDIISEFNNSKVDEIFEEVKISLIAESYFNNMRSLYKSLGKDEYKLKAIVSKELIISYAVQEDIIRELRYFKGDLSNFEDWISFIKKSKLKGRVKKSDLISVFNLNNL